MSGWETRRLSKHFILLDFMADHAIYKSGIGLSFSRHWNSGYQQIAERLCHDLLEPIMEAFGPISIADAFWPQVIEQADRKAHAGSQFGPKHRWQDGEATVDIALWDLVDKGIIGPALKKQIDSLATIAACRDRVITYPNTEFACVTWKGSGAKKGGSYLAGKKQSLRAHHIRVGRFFCLLDFCRKAAALEAGQRMVPQLDSDLPGWQPIAEEAVARACAALLDPLVEGLGPTVGDSRHRGGRLCVRCASSCASLAGSGPPLPGRGGSAARGRGKRGGGPAGRSAGGGGAGILGASLRSQRLFAGLPA